MKILKLIVFMLLTANFAAAQNTYSAPHAVSGNQNTIIGVDAGKGGIGNNNVGIGFRAMESATGASNTCLGYQAGQKIKTNNNVFVGINAGINATGGIGNVGIGQNALRINTLGDNNFALGSAAGFTNTTGNQNIFLGSQAGRQNDTGSDNTYIGNQAAHNQKGSSNVAIGAKAGLKAADLTSSTYNVFLGVNAGKNRATSNARELYIQSQDDLNTNTTPLVYGQFPYVDASGTQQEGRLAINYDRFPIATDGNPYTLAVNGKTVTEEVKVMLEGTWPDYVFAEDYKLMSLTDLEAKIETLGHLPGVPSAEEVEENGHELGQMDAILLEKVEELTLHLIEMNKAVKTLQESEKELREENKALQTQLNTTTEQKTKK